MPSPLTVSGSRDSLLSGVWITAAQVGQGCSFLRHRLDPPGLAPVAGDYQTARHRQMRFHPGSGPDLERGAERSVGDQAGGVLRGGLCRHRQGDRTVTSRSPVRVTPAPAPGCRRRTSPAASRAGRRADPAADESHGAGVPLVAVEAGVAGLGDGGADTCGVDSQYGIGCQASWSICSIAARTLRSCRTVMEKRTSNLAAVLTTVLE